MNVIRTVSITFSIVPNSKKVWRIAASDRQERQEDLKSTCRGGKLQFDISYEDLSKPMYVTKVKR